MQRSTTRIARAKGVGLFFWTLLAVFTSAESPLSLPPLLACDCVLPPPPAAALEEAAAVFRGTVTTIERLDARVRVTFALAAVWKGPVGETSGKPNDRSTGGGGVGGAVEPLPKPPFQAGR